MKVIQVTDAQAEMVAACIEEVRDGYIADIVDMGVPYPVEHRWTVDELNAIPAAVDEDRSDLATLLDQSLAELGDFFHDAMINGGGMTCSEAETIACLYRRVGLPGDADDFIADHVCAGDDEGDWHVESFWQIVGLLFGHSWKVGA
jgi:hypothetical protein